MNRTKLFGLLLVMVLPLLTFAQQLDVDFSVEHQVIDGFGGMNHTSWVQDFNDDQREKIFSNTPGNMGLSILRIHIDPDPERFIEQVPTSKYAIENGAIVFATPWNPPAELLDESAEYNRIPYENYGAYLGHLNSFNAFMSENDAPLYAISIQNEPDYGEWTRWTADEMVTFAKEFAQDIDNRVIAPESFQFIRDFTDPLLNDDDAAANIDIIGGHIYGGGLFDYPLAREKGKKVWMTEHLTGSNANATNNWGDALFIAKEINDCMEANFNAYVWWYIRRFYGLMTDDGNISHKGYVMSHYSKFVRPGATRVDASVSLASNVYATAFKNDTDIDVVLINMNSSSQEISINLQETDLSELTFFSSNGVEYLANKGVVAITDGTMTVTLEPFSVSTVTSHPEVGGKFENAVPVVNLGEDLIIEDTDGNGFETIELNASAVTDADGEIIKLSWAVDDTQASWTSTFSAELPIGEHIITLAATDNDGARTIDTLKVTITSLFNTELWFEAECVEVGATWEIGANANASNITYVNTPAGTESAGEASENIEDLITVTFTTEEEGAYKVWARIIAPSANDDSFWVRIDDSAWAMWNGIPGGTDWQWDDVHDGGNDNPMFYNLAPGEHTLQICFREDGALLDKILISNTGVIPEGIGGEAEVCMAFEATTELWYEAECLQVGSEWATYRDEDASNGGYVVAPNGTKSVEGGSSNANYQVKTTFEITEGAIYRIWGRVKTATADDDSFWVRIDDTDWVNWNGNVTGNTWAWDDVHGGDGAAVEYFLETGEHTLNICFREDGAKLDKILIENTGVVPADLGGEATTCEFIATSISSNKLNSEVFVYPNPSKGNINIEWASAFNNLEIMSLDGKTILSKKYDSPIEAEELNMNLESGMYIIILRNNATTHMSRLIIE